MDRDDNSQQFLEHQEQEYNEVYPEQEDMKEFVASHEHLTKESKNGGKE